MLELCASCKHLRNLSIFGCGQLHAALNFECNDLHPFVVLQRSAVANAQARGNYLFNTYSNFQHFKANEISLESSSFVYCEYSIFKLLSAKINFFIFCIFVFIRHKRHSAGYGQGLRTVVSRMENLYRFWKSETKLTRPKTLKGKSWSFAEVVRTRVVTWGQAAGCGLTVYCVEI